MIQIIEKNVALEHLSCDDLIIIETVKGKDAGVIWWLSEKGLELLAERESVYFMDSIEHGLLGEKHDYLRYLVCGERLEHKVVESAD